MKKLLLAVLFGTLAACGGGGSSSSSSSSAGCCLNGQYWKCSSSDTANKCFQNNDTSGCSRDSSKDSTDGGLTCNG